MMRFREKKGLQVLGYTLVVFGALCLTRTPTTNSKFYSASDNNGDYYKYKIGLKKLSYVSDNSNEKIDVIGFEPFMDGENQKVKITFRVPRNEIDIEDNTTYTYSFDTKDSGCQINEPVTQTFTGYNTTPITVSMTCDARVKSSEDELLSIKATLDNQVSAETYVEVYEKVNNEEEFLYRRYDGTVQSSSADNQAEDHITLTSSTKFTEFIQWILKYINSKSELSNGKESIKSYLEEMIIKNIESTLNVTFNENDLSDYIDYYNSWEIIPQIDGIKHDGGQTYAIDSNLLGYAKTYNANKNLTNSSNTYDFYFTTTDETEIEDIFKYYSTIYLTNPDDSEQPQKIIDYVVERGGVYQVLQGNNNNKIAGIIGIENDSTHLRVNNKKALIQIINIEPDFYYIDGAASAGTAGRQFAQAFSSFRGIMEDNQSLKNIITYSYGAYDYTNKTGTPFMNYIYRPISGINDGKVRYFIFRSETKLNDDSRFILMKIEPDENNTERMNIYFMYLDEAINVGPDGLFKYNIGVDEIYININTSRFGNVNDYRDAQNVVTALNSYLSKYYGITNSYQAEANNHIATSDLNEDGSLQYYYNYKYEFVSASRTLNDENSETLSVDNAEISNQDLEVESMIESSINSASNPANEVQETPNINKNGLNTDSKLSSANKSEEDVPATTSDNSIKEDNDSSKNVNNDISEIKGGIGTGASDYNNQYTVSEVNSGDIS